MELYRREDSKNIYEKIDDMKEESSKRWTDIFKMVIVQLIGIIITMSGFLFVILRQINKIGG